jgi:cell division protein FtsL
MQKRATVAQQTREQMTQVGKTCLLMVMAALAIALDMCIWFLSVPRRALVHLAMWLNEEQ